MATLPPPYDRSVRLDPGEEALDCWFGMPVKVDPGGRVGQVPRFQPPNGLPLERIHTRSGLLLLTNRRVCYYVRCDQKGTDHGRPHAHLFASIPLPSVERIAILTSLTHRVVRFCVNGTFSLAQPDLKMLDLERTADLSFDMARGEDLDEVLSRIQAAGERCPPPLPSSRGK